MTESYEHEPVTTPGLYESWCAGTIHRLPARPSIKLGELKDVVTESSARYCGVPVEGVRSRKRYARYVEPRHLAWRVLREAFGLPYQTIGSLWNVDHTSISHGCERIASHRQDIESIAAICFDLLSEKHGRDQVARLIRTPVAQEMRMPEPTTCVCGHAHSDHATSGAWKGQCAAYVGDDECECKAFREVAP